MKGQPNITLFQSSRATIIFVISKPYHFIDNIKPRPYTLQLEITTLKP